MENTSGAFQVGYCYQKGIGTKKDLKKAFELYLKSAKLNHIDGIKNVGYCYRNGIGTKKDLKEADYWFRM